MKLEIKTDNINSIKEVISESQLDDETKNKAYFILESYNSVESSLEQDGHKLEQPNSSQAKLASTLMEKISKGAGRIAKITLIKELLELLDDT